MAVTSIALYLLCIGLSYWALQAIHLEKIIRGNRVMQARLLYILVAISLGSTVANFFINYLGFSEQLTNFLQ